MNLDFLDCGLPVEHDQEHTIRESMKQFRKYCDSLEKRPCDLTEDELQKFVDMQ